MKTHNPLPKILAFYRRRRRMPSYSELQELLDLSAKNAAVRFAEKLMAQGMLEKDEAGKLVPTRRLLEVPVLGVVEAGWPSPAEEELLDTISFDELLIGTNAATYLVKVNGDSMIEAGIMSGDMAVVERGKKARPGDIVIAQIDRDFTMKYLRKKGKSFYLEAANPKYPPLFPQEELKIIAVVTGVVRKYR
jgi:repressor LexA